MCLNFEDCSRVQKQVSDSIYRTDVLSSEGPIWPSHKRYEKPAQTVERSRKLWELAVFVYNTRS